MPKVDYQDLEDRIYKLFRGKLSEEFDILSSRKFPYQKRPDFTISKGETRLAIIELKPNMLKNHHRAEAEAQVTNLAYNEDFRYAIIAVDEDTFFLKDCFLNKNDEFKKMAIETICNIFEIIRNPYLVPGKEYRDAVFQKLEEIAKGNSVRVKAFNKKNRATTIMIDETSFFFEKEEVEDELFDCFLKKFSGDKVCRYTSLASLFRTINEGKQSMCCIVGMNDKSECTYADDYIRELNLVALPSTKTRYDTKVENKYYILSCMDKEKYDDLTMWRLYGDNTKGVNILYNLDKEKLKGFKLYHINYAEENGNHPTLGLIAKLMNLKVGNLTFKLRKWNEWKHFFKPYEYRDEKEIRLLYNKQDKPADKWILTSDFHIMCPLVEMKLDDFPLYIGDVKLGPNCPDIETNRLQIEQMLEEKVTDPRYKGMRILVQTSGIGTYRM